MLRLPQFQVERPTAIADAVALLAEHGTDAMVIAGGTDLLPNMKHELFTPKVVIALADIEELHGIEVEDDGSLSIGAMVTLDALAGDARVQEQAPALAQSAGIVSGPQLRRMGTLGGNVMLDTRCQWYNQTHFWRSALGFCLKKDGTECHVVAGGSRCVAAASNDTAPALASLGASLVFHSPEGQREIPIDELWDRDGIWNKTVGRDAVLVRIKVPATGLWHRGAYGKLRDRGSIDFPLFGVAVRLDVEGDVITSADLVAVGLQARPVHLTRAARCIEGVGVNGDGKDLAAAIQSAGEAAHAQCHPLANIPGDHDYRRAMVAVYVRHTLRAAIDGSGPVSGL